VGSIKNKQGSYSILTSSGVDCNGTGSLPVPITDKQ
jgi:hypothetical protein